MWLPEEFQQNLYCFPEMFCVIPLLEKDKNNIERVDTLYCQLQRLPLSLNYSPPQIMQFP